MRWGQSQEADTCRSCPAGSLSQLGFAEEASVDQDEQALSRGKHKKKGNKLLEKTELEKETGEPRSSADEGGGGQVQGCLGQGGAAAPAPVAQEERR